MHFAFYQVLYKKAPVQLRERSSVAAQAESHVSLQRGTVCFQEKYAYGPPAAQGKLKGPKTLDEKGYEIHRAAVVMVGEIFWC